MGSRGCIRLKVGLWVIGGGGGRLTAAEIRLEKGQKIVLVLLRLRELVGNPADERVSLSKG